MAEKALKFRVSMATGNDEAPDEDGAGQCGAADFPPKCEDPSTFPVVATESGPCEGSSVAVLSLRTYKRRKQPVRSSSAARSRQEGTANTDGMFHLGTQVCILLLRPISGVRTVNKMRLSSRHFL